MSGLVFVSPGSFSSPSGLPVIPVRSVPPIEGAAIDWAADELPNGVVEKWDDLLGGYTLEAPAVQSQWPVKTDDAVVFDGTNDRIDTSLPPGAPKTVVLVARIPNVYAGSRVFSGGTGPQFDFGTNGINSAFTFYAGGGMNANDYGAPDSDWHVFIIVNNGADSIISVDGIESGGDPGDNAGTTLRIGATGGAYHHSAVKRFAILPYAAGASERETIRSQMAAHYNIG